MSEKVIRLCYRKIIDTASTQVWDKYVFESTYAEFLLQAQLFNQEKKYRLFSELLLQIPAADKLHFLVSAAATGYLQQLNETVPDITDNLGRLCIRFTNYRFEIIQSDIKNKAAHRVAINFFSEPMTWHGTVGNYLLVSTTAVNNHPDGALTHMVPLQPFLSIYSIKTTQL